MTARSMPRFMVDESYDFMVCELVVNRTGKS